MVRVTDWTAFALITLVGVVLFLSVDASGDFAINQDWVYSTPIGWWSQDGRIALTDWQTAPLLPQIAAGVLWSEVFGFSHADLRNLTFALAMLTILALYGVARRLGLPSGVALLGALLPLASPVFLGLSFTFMAEVPFAAVMVLALYFFVRSVTGGTEADFALGAICLLTTTLFKPDALALALAVVIAEPAARGYSPLRMVRSLVLLAVSVGVCWIVPGVIDQNIGLPASFVDKAETIRHVFASALARETGTLYGVIAALLRFSALLGLFLLPMLTVIWPKRGRFGFFEYGLAAILIAALTYGSVSLGAGVFFPLSGDALTLDGLGPRRIEGPLQDGGNIAIAVTLLGHAMTVMAGFVAFRRGPPTDGANRLIALTAGFLLLAEIAGDGPFLDRHAVLPAILAALVVLARVRPDGTLRLGIATWVTLSGIAVSVVLVQDFFRWQDARYALISDMARGGATIDGGDEYNALGRLRSDPDTAFQLRNTTPIEGTIRIVHRPRLADTVLEIRDIPQFLGFRSTRIYAVE